MPIDEIAEVNRAQIEHRAMWMGLIYLVNAWKKLGLDDKTCELLCDMAMEGDRSMAEIMELKFTLGHTIAQGCPNCELRFKKQ
jgi:hypothetical protein